MDNTEKYYKSFGLDRSLPRSFLKKQELNQLFAIPKKEPTKLSAHIYNFEEDNTHQADILFLPHDTVGKKKYAYALIVVDVATGDTDGEPLLFQEGWNGPTGCLGSSPDPGCEFPASTSPKNTGESSKIILFNEYDEYKWASLMPKHDNFLLNKNMNFPYSLSFDPVSSPSNHLLKIIFFTSFFISDSTVLRKMDHFDISFVIWKLYRSRELTKPTLLDPDHFPCSQVNNGIRHIHATTPSFASSQLLYCQSILALGLRSGIGRM
jgi:hypothetical protein